MNESEHDYAIVVGLSDYEISGDRTALFRAPNELYHWLVEEQGLPKDHVITVGNVGGTDQHRPKVDRAFEHILELSGRRLYIYMSGVAAKLPVDELALLSPRGPDGTTYPAMPVEKYANGVCAFGAFSEVVLFADCLPGDVTAEVVPPPFSVSDPQPGTLSHFYAWAGGAIPAFTDTLLRGLQGGAINTDGEVTSKSLEKFLGLHGIKVRSASSNLVLVPKREPAPTPPPEPPPPTRGRPERVAAHADDPAIVDELGRRPFAEVVGTRIIEVRHRQEKRAKARGENDLAFMVHLHGPWGSGKTSVLNFLRTYLQEREWVVVEFNAWRHQRMRPPWWALIRTIYTDAMRQVRWWRRELLSLKWLLWRVRIDFVPALLTVTLLGVALWLFSENVELAPKIITAIAAAAGAVWAYSRSLVFGSARAAQTYTELRSDPLGPIVKLFRNLIAAIRRPVVVFIDDLDRCDGKYVIDLIEGIQTLFRTAPVTYVVAADRKWICSSFDQTYEEFAATIGDPGRPLGYLFLEKVFQVSASVPRLSKDVQNAYWAGLLRAGDSVDPRELETKRKKAEAEAAETVRGATTHEELEEAVKAEGGDPIAKAAIRAAAAKQITTPEAQKETEHRLQEFAELLEPNPRAMKRLVNAYGLHQAAHFLEGRSVAPEALARWTIVELRWPLLADHLAAHPEAVASIGKDTAAVPADLKPLFTNEEVCAVVRGGLGEAEIRTIIGR